MWQSGTVVPSSTTLIYADGDFITKEGITIYLESAHYTFSFFSLQLSHSLQDGPNAPQYFRLNQLEEECEFVSQKEFAKSKRFKLIQLRDKGVRIESV